MNWGFSNFREIIETVFLVIGSISILAAVLSYFVSLNNFRYEVMINCIERYQILLPNLQSQNHEERIRALQQYLDLCNEEIFYFHQGYIPDEVEKEWLDGMISFLPTFYSIDRSTDKETTIDGFYPEITTEKMLKNIPRIKKAFHLSNKFNPDNSIERMLAIQEIRQNIKKITYPCA